MTRAPRKTRQGAKLRGAGGAGHGSAGSGEAGQGELPFDAEPLPVAGKPPRRTPRRDTASARPPKKKAPKHSAKSKPAAKSSGRAGKGRSAGPDTATGPTGFGGWLWLLALGQLIVTARMIDTLMRMAGLVGTELWTEHPGLVTADLALYGMALLLQLGVIGAMVLRSRFFKPLFLVAIVSFFLIGRLEPLLAIAILGMDPSRLATRVVLVPMAIELGVSVVWAAYVLRSRRVKNTFVR